MIGNGNSLTWCLENKVWDSQEPIQRKTNGCCQEAGVAPSSQTTQQICKALLRSWVLLGGGGELCAFDSPYQKRFGVIAEVLTAQPCLLSYCAYCKRSVLSGSGKGFGARVLLTINYKCFVYQKVMIAWYCKFSCATGNLLFFYIDASVTRIYQPGNNYKQDPMGLEVWMFSEKC